MTEPSSQLVPFLLPPPPCAFKRRMKFELGLKGNFKPVWFVTPLYTEFPKIGNGSPITWKEFAEKFKLCATGMSPKRIQIPGDILAKEVAKYFKPITSMNGHSYIFNHDLVLIEKVEKL